MAVVLAVMAGAVTALVLLVGLLMSVLYVGRHRLRRWISSGPVAPVEPAAPVEPHGTTTPSVRPGDSLFDLMAPGDVLYAVLTRFYGTKDGIEDVVTSMLGGPGQRLDGSDTAASRNVTARITLASGEKAGTCRSTVEWTYDFPGMRNNHLFVIFGTHDRELASQVVNGRVFPLFELWLLQDEDEFNDFAREIQDSVRIGVTYVAEDRTTHVVEPRSHRGEPVQWNKFSEFVKVPDIARLEHLNVIQFDLHDLAHDDHWVTSIEKLTLRATSTAGDKGWFAWSVPFPCYVTNVVFDVGDLIGSKGPLEYSVGVSTSGLAQNEFRNWRRVPDCLDVPVEAWMLAGHAVTIVWRSAETSEFTHGVPEHTDCR
jgi:hypothetical protein